MTTVEAFFEELCVKYIHKAMIRHINMASLRTDFIDQIYAAINLTKEVFSKNNVKSFDDIDNGDVFDKVTSPIYEIPFWFNQTLDDDFVADYYTSMFKFIETQAQVE